MSTTIRDREGLHHSPNGSLLKTKKKKARLRRAGLTMLEMMVAMALLATVSTIIYGAFNQSFRVRTQVEDFYDRYRDVRMSMHRMAREISMAYLSKHHNTVVEQTTTTCFRGEEDKLTFTSLSHLRMQRDAKESDQAEIGYYIDYAETMNGDRVRCLMRREDPNLDMEPLRGGITQIMAENVTDITFEYWDPTREIGDDGWVKEWDACQEKNSVGDRFPNLPERVKITLEFPALKGNKTESWVVETRPMLKEALQFQ